jgi:hypothetical protein
VDWKKLALVAVAVVVAGYLGARLGGSSRSDVALAGGGGSSNIIAFSTDAGSQQDGNRIVIINPAKSKILVYRLNNNDMGLIVVRGYEYDQELLFTPANPPGVGYTYQQVKTEVEKARAGAAGGAAGGM